MIASLTEKRLARSDDNTAMMDDRSTSGGLRTERVSGERTPTYRGEAMHYQKDLGFSTDDETADSYRAEVTDYNKKLDASEKDIEARQGTATERYNTGVSQINAASLPASDFDSFYSKYVKENTTEIPIYHGQTFEGFIRIPTASYGEFMQQVAGTGYYKVYEDKGRTNQWAINIAGYGKEFYESVNKYTREMQTAINTQYDRQYGAAQQALDIQKQGGLEALGIEYGAANSYLAQTREQVQGLRQNVTRGQSALRLRYQDKLKNINFAIGSLKTNGE